MQTFTEEECQLRIRLWGIVMVHDRGTSLQLGRPLAVSPADSNTPHVIRNTNAGEPPEFSEHFLYSFPIADIQADIINSLYAPAQKISETTTKHAKRIIRKMVEFRKQLPETYQPYFDGTEDWTVERRSKLLEQLTDDQGLTLLKLGISRILLLRALFSSEGLEYSQRYKALVDGMCRTSGSVQAASVLMIMTLRYAAIIASHNVILIHYQLIKYPDIAFFVSPIPLHIAAMVILFGHMSRCDRLPRQVALEDIWMALDMLPRLRWRWERKDLNGAHPLIAKLAEKVFDTNLHEVGGPGQPVLFAELDWDTLSPASETTPPTSAQQSPTQTRGGAFPNAQASVGQQIAVNGASGKVQASGSTNPNNKSLPEVPSVLFWPLDPQNPIGVTMNQVHHMGNNQHSPNYQPIGTIGCHPSQESYMLDEKDPTATNAQMQRLMNAVSLHYMPFVHVLF